LGNDLFRTFRGVTSATLASSPKFTLLDPAGRIFGLRNAAADIFLFEVTIGELVGEVIGGGEVLVRDMGFLPKYSGGVWYGVSPAATNDEGDADLGIVGESVFGGVLEDDMRFCSPPAYVIAGESVTTEGRGETDLELANGCFGGRSGDISWLISLAA
jgi:hypothetical protein